jgi:hypothetical protein
VERAEDGGYDILLVAQLDRLSRDCETLVILERRLQRHAVEVASTDQENGDRPWLSSCGQLAVTSGSVVCRRHRRSQIVPL